MSDQQVLLTDSSVAGDLGVLHLQRYWEKSMLKRSGKIAMDAYQDEWNIDITLLAVLGLGLEQTIQYLYGSAPGFAAFEKWVLEVNGGHLQQARIDDFNKYIISRVTGYEKNNADADILNMDDLDLWDRNGYIIIRNAVTIEDCEKAIDAICDFINIKRADASTWYDMHPSRKGIMVQLFQHPSLEKNRRSPRIRAAYEQLWQRKDLWLNTDRAGFNPPETANWKFPGPRLHWDVSLELPIPFGLQGILYLSDTKANQGAFTLVPGFHNGIEKWLNDLAVGIDPRNEDLYALGAEPVIANAGDFIIWHQALPHGSSVNSSSLPRFVQYINYAPLDAEIRTKWK